MEFKVATCYGESPDSYKANNDPSEPSQGVLQGSKSSVMTHHVGQHSTLLAYSKHATPAIILHPSRNVPIAKRWASGCMNDMTLLVNDIGIIHASDMPLTEDPIDDIQTTQQENLQ